MATTSPALRVATPLDALKHRDFAMFWCAALVSNIGSWMQNLTVPYVIFQTTRSVTWSGAATFLSLVPSVPFSPLGGALADRYPRRKILLITQSLFVLLALTLWLEWQAGYRNPWALIAPVAAGGALSGINMPSWQAFVFDLVPSDILSPAIALNSSQFHLSRAVGPILAGFVLDRFGPSWTFLANAFSFVAVIGVLLVLRPTPLPRTPLTGGIVKQTSEAARYVWTTPKIRWSLVVVVLIAFFGHPIMSLATPLALEVFGSGARGVGVMTAGFGTGAGLGVLAIARVSRGRSKGRLVQSGLVLYSLVLLANATSRNLAMAFAFLVPLGLIHLVVVSMTNTLIQASTHERMRGRVLSLYFAGFSLCYSVGAYALSSLADQIGLRTVIAVSGSCLLSIAVWLSRGNRLCHHVDGAAV